jgi:DNA-binding response OmpR family regulator
MSNSLKTKAEGHRAGTIMVVEPEILTRMVIADYLRECGYKVIEGVNANDVFVVLRAPNADKVNIILTEVNLTGDTDGFALAQQVRQDHPGVDVIITSGAANAANRASDLCDDGPLGKPYHSREVVQRIKMLQERRRTSETP